MTDRLRGCCQQSFQQFVEDLNIGYARMLGCQKYKLDRPLTQTLAESPHQWGLLAISSSTITRSMRKIE